MSKKSQREISEEPAKENGLHSKPKKDHASMKIVFKSLSIIVICVILGIWSEISRFYSFSQAHGLRYWSYKEFFPAVIAMLLIFFYRYSAEYLLRGWIDKILDNVKYKGEERASHIKRMTKWVCDIIFYTLTTLFGYWVLWGTKYLPAELGGSGKCSASLESYPFQEDTPYIREYYLLQIGNHMFAFFDNLLFKRGERNFYEMMLHHILALSLTMMSFQLNLVHVGSIVLIIHDPGDIFLCISRFYSDSKCKKMSVLICIFILNLFVWIYLRLYVFPSCVIFYFFKTYFSFTPEAFSVFRFTVGLIIAKQVLLISMHIYWAVSYTHLTLPTIYSV
eukprot:TRINITY_DN4241_c0_g1_i4.p1 TRINITY_DN4241_c0_g1~~TRINITY_DN4241_c0_g1_i4.p1  ORF type:complete len:335 (-),score=52.54 TRINITY_DN4241_c0_g1_i4:35-1039(-)